MKGKVKQGDVRRMNVYLPVELYAEILKNKILKNMTISQYFAYLIKLDTKQENQK